MANAKTTPAGRLVFSLVQGSADAFVQAEIETGLQQVGQAYGYRVIEIGVKVSPLPFVDACYFDLTFTRQSVAATPSLNDRSLIWGYSRAVELATSGAYTQEQIVRWQPPDAANVIVVENPLYVQLDSGSTSIAMSATGYILYESVKLTDTERLSLIAQSLATT